MSNPLISIIVPVYKVEKYLNRCVESIVYQTYDNLEIILVDDGSPDNCPKICDEWAEKDSRIKVIHKENDGLANARNSGIEVCIGEYVMFVDSDDYLQLDMVEFLYRLIQEHKADISRCGFYFCYENGNKESASEDYSVKELDEKEVICDLLTGGHIAGVAWNKLYKKDIIKSHHYCKSDGCSEDFMYNYRIYIDKPKTVFCDEPKYNYVIRDSSITNQEFTYGAFDIIRAKEKGLEYAECNDEIMPWAIKGYVISAFIVLSGCIQNDAFPEDEKKLIDGILKYKKQILRSDLYSRADKIKTLILSISPKFYRHLIKRKYNNE